MKFVCVGLAAARRAFSEHCEAFSKAIKSLLNLRVNTCDGVLDQATRHS
jgi:hypothetical protein